MLVNPTPIERTVTLEPGLRRFAGRQAADWNDGTAVSRLVLPAKDGIILVREAAK